MDQGVFIVLEGADGSGKTTQFKLLTERLRAVGYDVEVFDFPRYNEPSSHFIKSYLNGDYGPADKVSPYTASLFYALDRYESAPKIRQALDDGKVVLSDRYVGSNMGHQGSKFKDPVEQRGFFLWEDSLEFQLLGIPRPTINLFLRVPAEVSFKLIGQRSKRSYTDKSHDEHESDLEHLHKTVATYDLLCQLFPKDFKAIDSAKNGSLLSVTEINDRIWQVVRPLLPKRAPNRARGVTLKLDSLGVETTPGGESQPSGIKPRRILKDIELKKISLLAANYLIITENLSGEISDIAWPKKADAYYLPRMPAKVAEIYKSSMSNLAKLNSELRLLVNAYWQKHPGEKSPSTILKTLPQAAICNVKLSGDDESLMRLAQKVSTSPLEEVRWAARQIQTHLGQQTPTSAKIPASSVDRPQSDTIARLVKEHLPQNIAPQAERLTLLEAWPRNEFDLLADSIYPYSQLQRSDIEKAVGSWKYPDKQKALSRSIRSQRESILEQVHYKWDVLVDFDQLRNLLRSLSAESLQLQKPTPRYGYEITEMAEEASVEELYQQAFDESLKLFSSLQASGDEDVAAYATLVGHRLRCEFTVNGRELFATFEGQVKDKSSLVAEMIEKVAEVHPLLADSILSKVPDKPKRPAKRSGRGRRRSSSSRSKNN